MTTFYYLVAAILTSQPSVGYKGFDAQVVAKYTNATACNNAVSSVESLIVDTSPATITVDSNTKAFCVAAPSVSGGISYTLVANYWAGRNNTARNVGQISIPGFQSNAGCVSAGEAVENGIESHFATAGVPNVFVNYRCLQVQ